MPPIVADYFSSEDFAYSDLINSILHSYLIAVGGEFDYDYFNARGPFN